MSPRTKKPKIDDDALFSAIDRAWARFDRGGLHYAQAYLADLLHEHPEWEKYLAGAEQEMIKQVEGIEDDDGDGSLGNVIGKPVREGEFYKVKANPETRKYGLTTRGPWQARGDDRAWPGEVGKVERRTWTTTDGHENSGLWLAFSRGRQIALMSEGRFWDRDAENLLKVKAPSAPKLEGLGAMTSMTYGTLPEWEEFSAKFEKVAADGYDYELKGSDEAVANSLGIESKGEDLNAEEVYDLLQALAEAWHNGDDGAGDLASGILQTLDYEWI